MYLWVVQYDVHQPLQREQPCTRVARHQRRIGRHRLGLLPADRHQRLQQMVQRGVVQLHRGLEQLRRPTTPQVRAGFTWMNEGPHERLKRAQDKAEGFRAQCSKHLTNPSTNSGDRQAEVHHPGDAFGSG